MLTKRITPLKYSLHVPDEQDMHLQTRAIINSARICIRGRLHISAGFMGRVSVVCCKRSSRKGLAEQFATAGGHPVRSRQLAWRFRPRSAPLQPQEGRQPAQWGWAWLHHHLQEGHPLPRLLLAPLQQDWQVIKCAQNLIVGNLASPAEVFWFWIIRHYKFKEE